MMFGAEETQQVRNAAPRHICMFAVEKKIRPLKTNTFYLVLNI